MSQNWNKIWAIQKSNEKRILKVCPEMKAESGIYLFYRTDELGQLNVYVGKATKSLLYRTASHLSGYQYIDISIKKHGLFDSVKNTSGYKVKVLEYCEKDQCNELERKWITHYQNIGAVLKNIESGGQEGKTDINERRASKGYRDGLKQGANNQLKEIKVLFDKYLDFFIKGKPNKLKERKYNEFCELLSKL